MTVSLNLLRERNEQHEQEQGAEPGGEDKREAADQEFKRGAHGISCAPVQSLQLSPSLAGQEHRQHGQTTDTDVREFPRKRYMLEREEEKPGAKHRRQERKQ